MKQEGKKEETTEAASEREGARGDSRKKAAVKKERANGSSKSNTSKDRAKDEVKQGRYINTEYRGIKGRWLRGS